MKSIFRMLGLALVLCGAASLFYYFSYFDTSVYVPNGELIKINRVHNIGLLRDRSDGITFSIAAVVLGLLSIYLGRDATIGICANKKKCPYLSRPAWLYTHLVNNSGRSDCHCLSA